MDNPQIMNLKCCPQNPSVSYITFGKFLCQYDHRSDKRASVIYSAYKTPISAVSSIGGHSLLLAIDKEIHLMDRRFMDYSVSRKKTAQVTTIMKSIYGHTLLAGIHYNI